MTATSNECALADWLRSLHQPLIEGIGSARVFGTRKAELS
jgi:hypothetical protein